MTKDNPVYTEYLKKLVKRWYYILFKRGDCFKMTLSERLKHKYDPINSYNHEYLGNDWWHNKNK